MVAIDDNSLWPFGSFKGQKLANLPAWYLLWAYDNLKLNDNLKKYIDDNRQGLEQEKRRADRENYR